MLPFDLLYIVSKMKSKKMKVEWMQQSLQIALISLQLDEEFVEEITLELLKK